MSHEKNSLKDHLKDPHRLAALRSTALLDTPAEEAFDRLSRLAVRFTGAPIGLVSLVDVDRQFFKSCIGLPEPWCTRRETPLSHSFCQHNRVAGVPLVIDDAREHPLFKDNPAVRDLSVVAYLGIPLVSADGYVLGSFCVLDTRPRFWSEREVETLQDLASAVMAEISLRSQVVMHHKAKGERDELKALYSSLQKESEARRRTEASLRETMLRQDEVVRSANIGLWEYDFSTGSVQYSLEWKKQIGYEDHEISDDYSEWESRVHPDDLDGVLNKISDSRAGLSPNYEAEFRFRHRNGSYLFILAQGSVITDEKGRPAKMMGSHIGITRQNTVEAALNLNRGRYQKLFEYAPYGIVIADQQSNYTDANPCICRMLGYSRSELIGMHARDIVAETEINNIEPALAQIKSTADYLRVWRFRRRDGSVFDAEVSVTVLPDDHLLAIIKDITQRKLAEEELRESEAKLRLFIDHAPAALAMFDRDMRYLAVSRLWLSDYGFDGEDIIGLSHYEIFPEIPDHWREVHRRGLRGEVVQAEEDAFERQDGTVQWLHWVVRPWYKADGTVGGIVIFTEDLTERKRMEEERGKLQNQLYHIQRLESVGRLAGGVAHDYNNMLSVIIGYSEMALSQVEKEDPLSEDIKEILKAAQRSMVITRQLLTFSRQQVVSPALLHLNRSIDDSLNMIRQLIGENIDLVWQPGEGFLHVEIDPGQVDQILANLCINARDAITGTGQIVIETERRSVDMGYCSQNPDCQPGEYAVLTVSDNGIGMEAEDLEKIFEPFFTTKESGYGTGLGLATVYGIVKQNGGFTSVYSEAGHGTTFRVHLPCTDGRDDDPAQRIDTKSVPQGYGETVLVVEDELSILRLIETILGSIGYRVVGAATPADALKQVERHGGDLALLITDVIMPQMSGRELFERIAAMCPKIDCLYISGYPSSVVAEHGVTKERGNYLQKPFSKNELAVRVREVLESTRKPH